MRRSANGKTHCGCCRTNALAAGFDSALVEIERARSEPVLARGLLERIERYAQRALTLADDFVQLARAESQAYVLEPVSMTELMIDASDEVWPQAHAKRITLQTDTDNGPLPTKATGSAPTVR